MVSVDADEIPDELEERDQWLMWDASADTPRRPHWRGNFGVSWSDPHEWHTFAEAVEAAQKRDSWGIGYVMAADNDDYTPGVYACVDIDGGIQEDGTPAEWVPDLAPLTDAATYVEFSPSGEGIHIPVDGTEIPEWWTDGQIDDHTGVDVLTNKFCTFTGDKHPESGSAIASIDPTPWLFDAYEAIHGESPTLSPSDGASNQSDYDGEEWLEEADVEEALDHIDPDMAYPEWRDIGFAVHDFDSGPTGRRLFEEWSRGGTKWDDDTERYIDAIWESADPGDGVTVATLVHEAQQNGWETPTSSTQTPEPPDTDTDGADEETWGYVRDVYDAETNKVGRKVAADTLESGTTWMYVVDSETLWVYDAERGYFNPWGEQTANRVLERNLGTHYSQTEAKEIIARLEARNQTRRKELNARTRDSPLLCVGNGVVDLETGDVLDHSPEFKFTRGLSWDYDPATANPEPVQEFLDDVTKREEDRDTLLDHLAHGLMPGHPYRAFVVMYGPGSNGKTRVGKLLRGFVGEENAASVELQDLTGDDSFATGGLPGAFVNVGDDISVSEIRDTSIIKSLTGDGTVRANEKYEKQYEFENEAAMFFSANEPPRIREKTDAISDRLYPIEMPYRFVDEPEEENEKKKVPGIAEELLSDDAAMRGLLLLSVKHAQDVIEQNGQYSMPEGPRERREMYEAASDPIKRFALDHFENAGGSAAILKEDAYSVYTEMCEREGERAASADVFKQTIGSLSSIDLESTRTRKVTPGDSRDNAWRYVTFADSVKELMSPRLRERYFSDAEPESESTEADADGSAFGATPLTNAAESLTGYVTVTAEIVTVDTFGNENPTTKAILRDESGAMDLVTWDDAFAEELTEREGETVAIVESEVTEHPDDGTRQLQPVDGLTEIQSVQEGVGHTATPSPGENQNDLQATATDGGDETPVPDDAKGATADVRRLVKWVQDSETPLPRGRVVQVATERLEDTDPDRAEDLLDKACREGLIEETGDGYRA